MARPKGSPKVGGRQKGTPNKATDLRTAAREYTQEALNTLALIMRNAAAPEAARVSASDKLLDRGWGRPHQTIQANVTRLASDLTEAELLAIAAGSGEAGPSDEEGARVTH